MKKNITRAIKIADYLIYYLNKNAKGMEELVKNWNKESQGLGLEIASAHRVVAQCIEQIKESIQSPKERKIVKPIS